MKIRSSTHGQEMHSKRNDKNRKTEELITKDDMVINSGKSMCSCIDAVDMRYVVPSQDARSRDTLTVKYSSVYHFKK